MIVAKNALKPDLISYSSDGVSKRFSLAAPITAPPDWPARTACEASEGNTGPVPDLWRILEFSL